MSRVVSFFFRRVRKSRFAFFFCRRKLLPIAATAALASGTMLQVGGCGATADQLTSNLLGTGAWDTGHFEWSWDHTGGGSMNGDFDSEP